MPSATRSRFPETLILPSENRSSRREALKTTAWGLVWIVGAVWFWLGLGTNPLDDLRLMLSAKTTQGQIIDTWEDAGDGDDGRVHWSSAIIYSFKLPSGREVKGVSKGNSRLPPELADLKNPVPVEVEYVPSRPSLNRLQGDGSQSLFHWLWRTALSIFLLALFASPGFKLTRDGLRSLPRAQKWLMSIDELRERSKAQSRS